MTKYKMGIKLIRSKLYILKKKYIYIYIYIYTERRRIIFINS